MRARRPTLRQKLQDLQLPRAEAQQALETLVRGCLSVTQDLHQAEQVGGMVVGGSSGGGAHGVADVGECLTAGAEEDAPVTVLVFGRRSGGWSDVGRREQLLP